MTKVSTRAVLLIEDNPRDELLVREFLAEPDGNHYTVLRAQTLSEAAGIVQSGPIDAILLDLRLPETFGADTVRAVRAFADRIPIVVLTGTDDDTLAQACIEAGAQDYLTKGEVRSRALRRAIGYALARTEEGRSRDLRQAFERYRALSSTSQGTTTTAAMLGSGAIAARNPMIFDDLVHEYLALFNYKLNTPSVASDAPRVALERIVTAVGDLNGGPRDVLDVHVAALEKAMSRNDIARSPALVLEARLVALEMMGQLVDYYRVGFRRRRNEGL